MVYAYCNKLVITKTINGEENAENNLDEEITTGQEPYMYDDEKAIFK